MGLSSNTILHTTDKKGLLGILKDFYLKPTYCNEKILSGTNIINAAFPMVSFSDFPISELKFRHSYGRYGIGLSKNWARTNKLNPVLYVEKKSQLISDYFKQFSSIKKSIGKIDTYNAWGETIIHLLSFMKNYEGNLKIERLNINENKYRFSDEREWRFVPAMEELKKNKIPFYIDGEYFSKNKKECNEMLSPLKIPFSKENINYIIVDKEAEINEFIDYLMANHLDLTLIQSHKLCSRIITMTRIKYDF
jgi:hypothetical protein